MDNSDKCVATAPAYPNGYAERQQAELDHFRAQTRLINAQAAQLEAALTQKTA